MQFYIGLVHYPVYNRNHEIIASAITNLDLHDLSRLARTYGARGVYVISPLGDQQGIAERIRRHWTEGFGADYNPFRKQAFDLLFISPTLERSVDDIIRREGVRPVVIATDASKGKGVSITYPEAKKLLRTERTVMLLFGTAWGLTEEVFGRTDYALDPIEGITDYNHLSVRTAAAIILDRLAGDFDGGY
ncbi:MAG: RNA methyltransferase [Deltaproteobacteria bacterium]|nr:RNA methyltransferase [Deltaproteobacteria bacterium]